MMDWVVNALFPKSVHSDEKWSEPMSERKMFKNFRWEVKRYFYDEFPGCQVEYSQDFDALSWMVRVLQGPTVHVLKFEPLFCLLGKNGFKPLVDSKLSKFMKDNEGKQVMVTKERQLIVL